MQNDPNSYDSASDNPHAMKTGISASNLPVFSAQRKYRKCDNAASTLALINFLHLRSRSRHMTTFASAK